MRFLFTLCLLFFAVGPSAYGQETTGDLIPMESVKWDAISDRLDDSDVVVVALLDSVNTTDPDDVSGGQHTPKATLTGQLRKLRALGGETIPGGEVPFPEKVSLFVVENFSNGDEASVESHQERAKALYRMLDARQYVMSNPVIFVAYKGKLVRSYGVKYHSPGRDGALLAELVTALLSPQDPDEPPLPEIAMMKTLAMREEQGDQAAIDYLRSEFLKMFRTRVYYRAYSYFWTEAQVRSGGGDSPWASKIYDMLFTTCMEQGDFRQSMGVVANLCSTLSAGGRYGRLAEVMAVWEQGHKMGGNRMDISSYKDLGPAIDCLPMIRHRDMPITKPSQVQIPAGKNAGRFHVNDAGAFADYASLHYSAGRWQESMEYTVWIRDWATIKETGLPRGEYATAWYAATSTLISHLEYLGFKDEALELIEEGLAAPHGKTYHGRWKIFLAADHLDSLLGLDRAPSDIVEQYEELIAKASTNGHISRGGVWTFEIKLAKALIKLGRVKEGEAIYDRLIADGSFSARRARLSHWIKTGRVDGVEEELMDLLRSSRESGQKMREYGLYRDYADFLDAGGRQREALLMRREAIRLAKSFGLFTHLPVEQSKLALLLIRTGNKAGAEQEVASIRKQLAAGGLPKSIVAEINANLAAIEALMGDTVEKEKEEPAIDLQPQRSVVIPVADLPWTTYLTLTNPGKQAKTGQLIIEGASGGFSVNEETTDLTITLEDPKGEPATIEFACAVDPGTFRLIHLNAAADTRIEGEIRLSWKDDKASSNATVMLEKPESGVSGAIIQAGDYRENPFYGVSMFLQYVTGEDAATSPPLRFVCSQPSRVEVYQLDGTPLAVDSQGNGSLLNQGDELFVKSDGQGNLILPLANGNATMNIILFPDNTLPNEGLTINIEAFIDGSWQLYSSNRLAK